MVSEPYNNDEDESENIEIADKRWCFELYTSQNDKAGADALKWGVKGAWPSYDPCPTTNKYLDL